MNLDCSDLHAWPLAVDAVRLPALDVAWAMRAKFAGEVRRAIAVPGLSDRELCRLAVRAATPGLRNVALLELARRADLEEP